MITQIQRIQNQKNGSTGSTLSPEFIAGALGHLDMIDSEFLPVILPPPILPEKLKAKSDLAQRWLSAMILIVGMGVFSLQHQAKPGVSAPTFPHAVAPTEIVKPTQASMPVKRKVKMSDLQSKLELIMKRADKINARVASVQ